MLGRIQPVNIEGNYQYECGWHTTWDNTEVYLRSSYELEYAQELDSKQINYEVESLRIKYFDTKLNGFTVEGVQNLITTASSATSPSESGDAKYEISVYSYTFNVNSFPHLSIISSTEESISTSENSTSSIFSIF